MDIAELLMGGVINNIAGKLHTISVGW